MVTKSSNNQSHISGSERQTIFAKHQQQPQQQPINFKKQVQHRKNDSYAKPESFST